MRSLLFGFLLLIGSSIFAQQCNPITQVQFSPLYNQVAQQNNDTYKLNKSIVLFSNKCLSSNQIKQVALLFAQDASRLEFCKIAIQKLADYPNRYEIYDAFQSFSNVFRLHDHIDNFYSSPTPPVTPPPAPPLNFPNYSYPSHTNYSGQKGCITATTEANFLTYANQINAFSMSERVAFINSTHQNYCFTTAHMMKLSSLVPNNNMDVMKKMFPLIYDLDNYPSAASVFPGATQQTEWITFCQNYLKSNQKCETPDQEFKNIKKSIQDKNFTSDMMSHAKMFKNSHCFSVAQIKSIMGLFMSDNDKMEIAKIFYDKCGDKNNYYQTVDALTFTMQKDQLRAFIKSKQ